LKAREGGWSRCSDGPTALSRISLGRWISPTTASVHTFPCSSATASCGSEGGKPAYVYELTQEGEDLFPKAYEPTLRQLLDILSEQLGPDESETLLKSVGRRLAEEHSTQADGARARLETAVEVLNELGGLAELEERDGAVVIRGYSCPLAGVTPEHPEVCRMAEALVGEVAGVSVREHCDRGERPRCCFEIASAGDKGQT
jgi:predicted ArsR family transcriptional regulator